MMIFDLDSTLVDARGASQLMGDWDAYGEELERCPAYEPMVRLVEEFQETQRIVLLTGRPERRRQVAEAWLDCQGINVDELLMRPEMNSLKEDELFKGFIYRMELPKLGQPDWLFTGRERIAEMARSLGIQSLLVTPLVQAAP